MGWKSHVFSDSCGDELVMGMKNCTLNMSSGNSTPICHGGGINLNSVESCISWSFLVVYLYTYTW